MSRVQLAPGQWADEGPRPGFLTGQRISGGPIVTRDHRHSPVLARSAEGQRIYREQRRAAYHAKAAEGAA